MLRTWLCQLDVVLHLQPQDPVLIKSGYATLDGPDLVPVSTLRNGQTTYYFPGTSLKGVLRSHFERIARTLLPGSVCIPYYDPKRQRDLKIPDPAVHDSFGCGFREPANGRPDNSATAYYESCAACRLFGSLRFAGRFSISDAYPLPGQAPHKTTRNGVGIDRFTGGTVSGVLFDMIVLEGGTFETHLRLVNYELWQLAATCLLLQDLQDEIIAIGSARSRGLGRVRGEVKSFQLHYVRPQPQLAGLYELVGPDVRDAYHLFQWDGEPIPLPSAKEVRGLRHIYDLTDNWQERLRPLLGSVEKFLKWHPKPLGRAG